jgi:prepilin-type N-terminal cleavage/methylation domain-containing protein
MSRGRDGRAPGGFTLVELLVTMALTGLILAVAFRLLADQQRLGQHQQALAATQQNLHATLVVFGGELREASATAGDVVDAGPTHIEFRSLRRAGFVCGRDPAGAWIDVVELGAPFQAGDSVLLFQDGPDPLMAGDDVWTAARVAGVGGASCAPTSVSSQLRRLQFVEPVPPGIWEGAPLRSFVRVRYSYGAAGAEGALFREENGGGAAAIVLSLLPPAEAGFRLAYRDSAGTVIPPDALAARLAEIARIDVRVAGSAPGGGGASQPFRDSIASSIHLRGNRKVP